MGNSATQFELAINAKAITLGYLAECGDAILTDKLLLTQPAWNHSQWIAIWRGMCGRVSQSSTPFRLAIVDGLDVRDSR